MLGWWLPALIFFAEMVVVTVGTLRIIFVAQGRKVLAPVLGFVEVLTWLFAISQVMQNLEDPVCFISFALGFTLGNFLGIWIEKKLALGTVLVRVISHRPVARLVDGLRQAQFGVTCLDGQGASGPVQIVMTVVKRRQLQEVLDLIEALHPQAFVAVDELQATSEGIFPETRPPLLPILPTALRFIRTVRTRLGPAVRLLRPRANSSNPASSGCQAD